MDQKMKSYPYQMLANSQDQFLTMRPYKELVISLKERMLK